MKTVKFTYSPETGYRCDTPHDQSGEYVRAEVARELLEACKSALDLSDHADGCRWFSFNISEMQTAEQMAKAEASCNCHLVKLRAAIAKATGN